MINQKIYHHRLGHSLFILGAFIFLIGLTIMLPANAANTQAFGVSEVIDLTNQARQQLNKPDLRSNMSLMNAAQMKAEDMVKEHYFAHSAPDGTVAWDYFKKVDYTYQIAGENLAITNETAQAVIDGWLNSTTHRDNLLSTQFSDFGIGMARFGDYQGHKDTYVVVALYGRLANSSVQSITARTIPAGTSAALKPRFITISPAVLAIAATLFMVAGIVLELKHIEHLHRRPNPAK